MDDIVDESRPSEEMEIDPEKEAYYINDPKKALKTFFDREGTVACSSKIWDLDILCSKPTHPASFALFS